MEFQKCVLFVVYAKPMLLSSAMHLLLVHFQTSFVNALFLNEEQTPPLCKTCQFLPLVRDLPFKVFLLTNDNCLAPNIWKALVPTSLTPPIRDRVFDPQARPGRKNTTLECKTFRKY